MTQHKVYLNHGIHGSATFQEVADSALRNGWAGWIMECPEEAAGPYSLGWHMIVSNLDYYKSIGYIPRARVRLVVEELDQEVKHEQGRNQDIHG